MSARSKIVVSFALLVAVSFAGAPSSGQAADAPAERGRSPAVCAPGDTPEPGIQGDVPAGATASYNCGVRLVGQLPRVGNVQGVGTCAYVRSRGGEVFVIDVSDPANPREAGSIPVQSGSESMRVMTNANRSILVSGSSVYDVRDCLHPVLKGEIAWPALAMAGIPSRTLPHDIRINHAGTKVYASFGLWEADISNLDDASTWRVTDHRCELAAQQPGPWQEVHRRLAAINQSLCADSPLPAPRGAGNVVAASPMQGAVLWPSLSHSPDLNANDTILYVGDQAGGTSGQLAGGPTTRIIDLTQSVPTIIGEVPGPGHGLDWFRARGRDYLVGSNEGGSTGIMNQGVSGDTCRPHPRPSALGWGFEAIVSDVTNPRRARNVSMLTIAINEPEFCEARRASGKDPWIAYHLIDNPFDAHFAAVNFGSAGLRIFDIRDPAHPSEVAYFNHGPLVHAGVGYYDAQRGLIYAAGQSGFWVLELEPQVRARLGL